MNKVLIISATGGTNLILGNKISNLLETDKEVINLEKFKMPLYTSQEPIVDDILISTLSKKFIESRGLIFCAPEYNGGSPPILINIITWLSVSTENWRDAFNNKISLIATHSGGGGNSFTSSFRIQLEHMGSIVYPRNIIVNSKEKFNSDSVKKILRGFTNLL